jgi:hypothetical protein
MLIIGKPVISEAIDVEVVNRRKFIFGAIAVVSLAGWPKSAFASVGRGLISGELTALMDTANFIRELIILANNIKQNFGNARKIGRSDANRVDKALGFIDNFISAGDNIRKISDLIESVKQNNPAGVGLVTNNQPIGISGPVGAGLFGPFRIGTVNRIGDGWKNHMVDYDQANIFIPPGSVNTIQYKPSYDMIPNAEWVIGMKTGLNSAEIITRT